MAYMTTNGTFFSTIRRACGTRKQDSSAPVEKDSSAPRHFGMLKKKNVKSGPHFLSNINWVQIGKQETRTPFSKLLDSRLMQQ
jgi:hypothetical protein